MARFTRSSASENPPSSPKLSPGSSKKRTRAKSPHDEQPPGKHPTQSPAIPSVGDVPIKAEQSRKILDILQATDPQGLLDRVFSVNESPVSLQTLLQDSSNYSLSDLRSAVERLFPVSLRNPRSRPSKSATQQQAFCNLALSLLDQASFQSVDFPGDLETLVPNESPDPQPSSSYIHRKPRYALVQHLPSGDYWTSLSSEASSSELKDLPRGHSELVAILPSPYPSTSVSDVPTLGSYHKTLLSPKIKVQGSRKISSGSFLDYGLYASFAPSFDQDGVELGRQELGQILLARQTKKNQKEKELKSWLADRAKDKSKEMTSVAPMDEDEAQEVTPMIDVEAELEELVPSDQLEAIKTGLGSLELELAVSALLEKNQRALRRLQELQKERLMADGGGSSRPKEGSEEWDTAQAILDSLTTLAELRPRSSNHENAPLIPPAAVLRTLHRVLPNAPTPGWYGNLPPGRTTVLRDDNTIKIKTGVPTPAPAPAPAPASTSAPSAPPAATNGYSAYSYGAYTGAPTSAAQTPYRPGAATANTTPYIYKPATTSGATSYYPTYTPQHQAYGQYSASGSAGTTAYGAWYNAYTPAATPNSVGTNGTHSGSGTPQPSSFAPSYSSFFGSNNSSNSFSPSVAAANPNLNGSQARTPAVANTVVKPGNQWAAAAPSSQNPNPNPYSAGTGATIPMSSAPTPTLPLHLRSQSYSSLTGQTGRGSGAGAGQLPGQLGQLGQQSSFYGFPGHGGVQYTPTTTSVTTIPGK